jgi:hypothetical protein
MQVYAPLINWLTDPLPTAWLFIHSQWECVLVMFAALLLVPKGLRILGLPQGKLYPLVALGLCAAYLLDTPGLGYSDALALPYLLLAAWLTLREATELLTIQGLQLHHWVRVFALGYWATGAFWACCFLAGFQPVGFDPVIVSLTAAHFHVAGFVLAVVVWCLMRHDNSLTNRSLGWAVLAGMPLVAMGITLSKLGFPSWIESFSGVAFACVALMVAFQHIRLFSEVQYPAKARRYWLAGASCLLIGASLAAVYAMRFQFPFEFINIPNMKIWHGTLNTLGFGWLVLRGWDGRRPTVDG